MHNKAGIPDHVDALEWMKKQIEEKAEGHEGLVEFLKIVDNTVNPDILIRLMILNDIAPHRYPIPNELYTKVTAPAEPVDADIVNMVSTDGDVRIASDKVVPPDGFVEIPTVEGDLGFTGLRVWVKEDAFTPEKLEELKRDGFINGKDGNPRTFVEVDSGYDVHDETGAFIDLPNDKSMDVLHTNADGAVDVVDPGVVNTEGSVHCNHAEVVTDSSGVEHTMLVGPDAEVPLG